MQALQALQVDASIVAGLDCLLDVCPQGTQVFCSVGALPALALFTGVPIGIMQMAH